MASSMAAFVEEWWIRHQYSPTKVAVWALKWAVMWAVMILITPAALIARLVGVRFLAINYKRIGHLAVEPDCFVKERLLGRHRRVIPFVCAPSNGVCNHSLLDCWRPHLPDSR